MTKTTKAKAWASLVVGGIGDAVAAGIVPDRWKWLAMGVITLASTYGVYKVPNRPAPPAL